MPSTPSTHPIQHHTRLALEGCGTLPQRDAHLWRLRCQALLLLSRHAAVSLAEQPQVLFGCGRLQRCSQRQRGMLAQCILRLLLRP